MSKIFRINTALQNGQGTLTNTIEDWGQSIQYTATEISQIPSSSAQSTNEPTSIPSPFARLELAKAAFAEVAAKGDNAMMAYRKIVSNCLDVAEIFFNFSMLKDSNDLEIIKWSYSIDLQNIPNDILKATLKLFFESDSKSLNIGPDTTFYFIRHRNTGKILGGTSPRTLFFSAANVKRHKGGCVEPEFIQTDGTLFFENGAGRKQYPPIELSNNHYAFSGISKLSQRDTKFQEYLHRWVKTNSTLSLPEISRYLESEIPPAHIAAFNNLPNNLNDYSEIQYCNANATLYPEIQGKKLYERQVSASEIKENSDFVVKSTIFDGENPPLILGGTAPGIENWHLDGDTLWGTRNLDPSKSRTILPDGGKYPWLTGEDFFEENIILLSKKVENGYFSGNHTNNNGKAVLLPIKDTFFEFFTTEELKNMVTIDGSASIVVTLSIPLKRGNVIFRKEYKSNNIIKLPEETDFMLFPNVRFCDSNSAFYRFGIFKGYGEMSEISARFYNKTNEILLNKDTNVVSRNTNDPLNCKCTTYALEKTVFDRIKIAFDKYAGVIIPNLEKKASNVSFTFAVDFGTTNTHVEYKTSENGNIRPFDLTNTDQQISWYVCPGDKVCQARLVADIDFIPEHIGYSDAPNIKVKFPTLTALNIYRNTKAGILLSFAHTNLVIPFNKRTIPSYDKVYTQLKWDANNQANVGYFIDNLCYLLHNKVVLNNGDLANTKIVWSYPLSMSTSRLGDLTNKWKESYAKYFGNNSDENCRNLPESLAPFYHYLNLPQYKEYINNMVSIDIGGGTTDVVFAENGHPTFATSFHFAANDLFGLGENVSHIVSKHKPSISEKISKNYNLKDTLASIEENTKFGDYASFFFSLKENEDLKDKSIDVDFSQMLKNDSDQKIVFLLFYSAIIYHTAQVMKAHDNTTIPGHLTFSGNGSRILNILGNKNLLEKIATLIFEKILEVQNSQNSHSSQLEIIMNPNNPKEITCKGAVVAPCQIENVDYKILLGTDNSTFVDNQTYASFKDDKGQNQVNGEVDSFINYVLNDLLQRKITKQIGNEKLMDALEINSETINKAKKVANDSNELQTITANKIREKEDGQIEETLFFLPIPGLLRKISLEIEPKEN
jgi:hypothetical protein